jgi:hypothetical protein
MDCKCGARTFDGHLKKVEGGYPGHVYTGFYWAPKDDKDAVSETIDETAQPLA